VRRRNSAPWLVNQKTQRFSAETTTPIISRSTRLKPDGPLLMNS
jgi:hypothetical protein